MKRQLSSSQRGATLVIAMIMLILLTLFVLAAINMSSINFRIMSNTQARNEALAAAQQAIEQVATTNFPAAPAAVAVTVDVGGGAIAGTTNYVVSVATPVCQNSIPIKYLELNITDSSDWPCFGSAVPPDPSLAGTSGNSYCLNQQWDLAASVSDSAAGNTGAAPTIHQGIGKRVVVGTACP